jgi:hypothetical protein
MVDGILPDTGTAETEEQGPSIRDDLRATYEKMASDDSDEGGQATATATSETDGDDGEKGAEADESSGESDDDGKEGEADKEPDAGSTDERLDAPIHWSTEHKATFEGLPAEGQAFLLERHKDMEADYTRRSQDLAEVRRAFVPFQQAIAGTGTSIEAAVAKLATIHNGLTRDPEAEIRRLARENGVNLSPSNLDEDDDEPFEDDDEGQRDSEADRQRDERIDRLETKQSSDATAASNARIQEFVDTTDGNGELTHPHFAQVQEQMLVLATGYRASGKTYTLQSVYDDATYLVPEVREQVLAGGSKNPAPDTREEKRKKVERADRASLGARGTSKAPAPKNEVPGNVREHLAKEYAVLAARD